MVSPAIAGPVAVNFKKDIKPIFDKSCVGCHNKEDKDGKLDLSTIAGIKRGGQSGKLFLAGKGSKSLIIKRLKGQTGSVMPMGGDPLKPAQISLVSRWIDEGAKM